MTSIETLTLFGGIAAVAIIHALHRIADAISDIFVIEDDEEEPKG